MPQNETTSWWLSSDRMTFRAEVRDGVVVEAAPIARRFIGQSAKNLADWMRKQGGFRYERLTKVRPRAAGGDGDG